MLPQLLVNGLIAGCVYSLVALGFGMIYNTTRLFHFAHGAVYTASAYIFFTFLVLCKWNPLLSFVLAMAFAAGLGLLIEAGIYYPLYRRGAPGTVFMIGSLGIYIFLTNLVAMVYGNETQLLRPGAEKTFTLGSVIVTQIQVLQVVAFLVVFLMFYLFMKKTKLGKITRGLADNPVLMTAIGINTRGVRLLVFAIGSVLAGLAAILAALDIGMDPHIGMPALLVSAVAVIVGGVGLFEGAVIGGFLLGLLQNLAVWKISARWQDAITFLVLILFLIFRPQGLLGRRTRLEEM